MCFLLNAEWDERKFLYCLRPLTYNISDYEK